MEVLVVDADVMSLEEDVKLIASGIPIAAARNIVRSSPITAWKQQRHPSCGAYAVDLRLKTEKFRHYN